MPDTAMHVKEVCEKCQKKCDRKVSINYTNSN